MPEIRFIQIDQDYPTIKRWWELRKFPPANPRFLPPTGLIASVEGVDVAAGFLFKSDANIAIMGNIVSNPEAPGKDRHEALDSLFLALQALASSDGFGMVTCSTNLAPLMERFEDHGFAKADEGVSHFWRILCP